MGRKSLTSFDTEKDEWYRQEVFYIDPRGDDSLYNEFKEFSQSLSNEQDIDLFSGGFGELLAEEQEDGNVRKPKGELQMDDKEAIDSQPDDFNPGGFFDEKLQILKEEIEDINRNLEERKLIEKITIDSIESEIDEVKRQLHEIYTWKKGEKSTIEFIRMEFLKQLASLYREKRSNSLNFWKDSVFEKRDRRNLLMEYRSLGWMDELAGKVSKK